MGEPRGRLEELVAELEAKKAKVEQVLKEFDLILPHLQQSLQALDQAGITDTGPTEVPTPGSPNIQEVPQPAQEQEGKKAEAAAQAEGQEAGQEKQAAEASQQKEAQDEEAARQEQAAAESAGEEEAAEGEEGSGRRSIASLVGGGE